MRFQKAIIILLVIFGLPYLSTTQTSHGGTPIGLQKSFVLSAKNQTIASTSIGDVDRDALLREDRIKGLNRFATGTDLSINLDRGGMWTDLANGDKLWRTKLTSGNALGVSILFKDFRLAEGAKLFVYSTDGSQVKGSYTHKNNKPSGKFMAGIIKGSEVIIEYYEPAAVSGMGYFEIYKAFKVYDAAAIASDQPSAKGTLNAKDFGDSSDCHINSNCSEAADWQEYKKGITRITMVFENAMGFCSGTLMNNVRQDNKPYILSAYHCAQGAPNPMYDHWQFDFGYESPTCDNPATEPTAQSIQGCEFRSGREESDFLLIELDQPIPDNFDVRYHGWDRSENEPDTAIMFHHPLGDIMKYSFSEGDIRIFNNTINWDIGVTTPAQHHFVTNYKQGAYETGSSGASFINENGHVVGQLNGGVLDCENAKAYYGRLFQSWSNSAVSNSLQPYLDPDNSGMQTLDAKTVDVNDNISISGTVLSVKDVPMESVTVTISGDASQSTTTDVNGNYTFSDLPVLGNYIVTPEKTTKHFDGISTRDLVILRREILGIEKLNHPALFIAADATNNGKVSTGDMLVIQRLLLGIISDFPANQSWRFYTSDFPSGLTGPDPFTETSTTGSLDNATISAPTTSVDNLDFVGIKVGDPSQSVDPNKE